MGIILLIVGMFMSAAFGQKARTEAVKTCHEASLARPGFGASYRDTLDNSDYGLHLKIPEGLTGWGADPIAPFHGFTIFLPSSDGEAACIVFEIHLRVELGERPVGRAGARVVLGNVPAFQRKVRGKANGRDFTDETLNFSITRGREADEGTAELVSPTRSLARNQLIFDQFISQIRFYGR
jgi:hypothetical protein